jgi:hypothetical protein
MTNQYIATYLIDHLAGSVAAVGLLEDLKATYATTSLADFVAQLQTDIDADRKELQTLMNRLNIVESQPRKVMAWLTEKFVVLKLGLDDKARGSLRLLESLEVVGLGIQGKLAMWHALNAVAADSPSLDSLVGYERLVQRAEEQRQRVELVRLEAAKAAFAPDSYYSPRGSETNVKQQSQFSSSDL